MQLYIIRHAQSENNALWERTGSSNGRIPDPELTAVGRQQAPLLANFLTTSGPAQTAPGRDSDNRDGFNLTHLYCSLMERAVQTAACIAQATGLPLTAWEEIHEWGGIHRKDEETEERIGLPGPNRAYFTGKYPALLLPPDLDAAGWWNRPAEPSEQRVARAQRVWRQLLDWHGRTDDRVAIVTHGGFTQSLLAVLLGFSESITVSGEAREVWFATNNVSISRIDFETDHVRIVYLNRVDFLPGALVT